MIHSFKLQSSSATLGLSAAQPGTARTAGKLPEERRFPAACVFMVVKQPTSVCKRSQANLRFEIKLPTRDAYSYNPPNRSLNH